MVFTSEMGFVPIGVMQRACRERLEEPSVPAWRNDGDYDARERVKAGRCRSSTSSSAG